MVIYPSNRNPADNATRGLQTFAAFISSVWVTGPEILANETHWPKVLNSHSDIVSPNFSERLFMNHQVF